MSHDLQNKRDSTSLMDIMERSMQASLAGPGGMHMMPTHSLSGPTLAETAPGGYTHMTQYTNPFGFPSAASATGDMHHPVMTTRPGMDYPPPNTSAPPSIPSSDYPRDMTRLTTDPLSVPTGMVESGKHVSGDADYIKRFSPAQHQQQDWNRTQMQALTNKKQEGVFDIFFNNYLMTLVAILLHFVFQLPALEKFLTTQLWFVQMREDTGSINVVGMVIKSLFFGLALYGIGFAFKEE